MEMKTMLSMPRMISSTVSVSKLTQISGLVSQSMARNLGEAPSDCKANWTIRRVETWEVLPSHEPQKVAQASRLFGADRLEACPTLQPAPRFMAPTHVQFLGMFSSHEPGGARLRRALVSIRCGLDGVSPHRKCKLQRCRNLS